MFVSSRALQALVGALLFFVAFVSAAETTTSGTKTTSTDTRTSSTKSRTSSVDTRTLSSTTPTTTSPTGADAGVFETTFQPFFATSFIAIPTATVSDPASPTESVGYFYPLRQGFDVVEGISYTINITSDIENNVEYFCWYPISGNWGLLPRILFYVTIIAALLLRHHQWLYAGALVASLTYSGVAAIQACLMLWRGPSFGDTDMAALLAVLGTSCILIVPLLNWSHTLRNIGKDEEEVEETEQQRLAEPGGRSEEEFDAAARTIVLYWAFLVLVGFICVFVAVVPLFSADIAHNWSPITSSDNTFVTCSPPNGSMDLQAGQPGGWLELILTPEFLDANGCSNPCSIPAPDNLGIFRSADELIPLSVHATSRFLIRQDENKRQRTNDAFTNWYVKYGLLVLPYILLQGLWASIFGRRTPGQARNVVYAYLTRIRITKNRMPLQPAPPFQKAFAKWAAFLSYFWAVFVLAVSIPMVVINVTAAEIFMVNIEASEGSDHVGAWGPWASVAMALIAAIFARYHDDIGYIVALSFHKFLWLMVHPSWLLFWRRAPPDEKTKKSYAKHIITGYMDEVPDKNLYRDTAEMAKHKALDKVSTFIIGHSERAWDGFTGEWRQLREFVKDPEWSRSNQGRHHRLQATACGCIIGCQCVPGKVCEDCRHEKGICREYKECKQSPRCKHSRLCMEQMKKAQRLRLWNPERRTVALALGAIHSGKWALDLTGTPIPVIPADAQSRLIRRDETRYMPAVFHPKPMVDSDSEVDGDSTGVPLPRWHDSTHERNTTEYRQSMKGILSHKSRYSHVSSNLPGSRGKGDTITSSHSVPTEINPYQTQVDADMASKKASRTVRVSEEAVHPMLRASFVSQEDVSPIEDSRLAAPARVRTRELSEAERSRRKSMAKDLPLIPQSLPKTPNPTPNHDTRSLASDGVSALSPVATNAADPTAPSHGENISPLRPSIKDTAQNSSSSSNVTKQSMSEPSPETEEPGTNFQGEYEQLSRSTGLTSSVERSIMNRNRRSVAYGPDIPRDRNVHDSSAPIPVHMEEPAEEPEPTELPSVRTPAENQILAPPFSDGAATSEATPPEESNKASQEPPPPQRRQIRHISQLVKLPLPDRGSGAFLSPQEKHALLDPPSAAPTPPIMLPPLSPPHPDSNVARSQMLAGYASIPHLSSLGPLDLMSTLDTLNSNVPEPPHASSSKLDVPSSSIPEDAATIEQAVQRQKSPKPPGYRSTVDYLQVHRPSTVMYADEITLRKDEFGVYQLVINGNQIIQPPLPQGAKDEKK